MRKIIFIVTSTITIVVAGVAPQTTQALSLTGILLDVLLPDQRGNCNGNIFYDEEIAIYPTNNLAPGDTLHVGINVGPGIISGGGNLIVAFDPVTTTTFDLDVSAAVVINVNPSTGIGNLDWTIPETLEGGPHEVVIYQQWGSNTYTQCSISYTIETEGEPAEEPENCRGLNTSCICDDADGNPSPQHPPVCEGYYCTFTGGPAPCTVKLLGGKDQRCIENDAGSYSCLFGNPVVHGDECRCELAVVDYSTAACYTSSGGAGIDTAIGCIPFNGYLNIATFFFSWGMGVAGGVAFLLIIFASFQIMVSAGEPKKLQGGKELLISAITGLLLVIFAAFLLTTIGVNILKIF